MTFRTWRWDRSSPPVFEGETPLTIAHWDAARQQVLDAMSRNACDFGVGMPYVLNHSDATYYANEYTSEPVKDKDNPVYYSDKKTRKLKHTMFSEKIMKRIADKKMYALGQHIALYENETFNDPSKIFGVPARNMIFTFVENGQCLAFMLAVHSDTDTKRTLNGDDYDDLYQGIYVDVVCGASSKGAARQMFTLLQSTFQCSITLKATADAMSYYPTLTDINPTFSYGTCSKKVDPQVNAEILDLLARDPHKGTPYPTKYANLSQERKDAVKLIFKHNLAHDQNSTELRWKTSIGRNGREIAAKCPYIVDGDLDDKEAKGLYENNCLQNGSKMSSCHNAPVLARRENESASNKTKKSSDTSKKSANTSKKSKTSNSKKSKKSNASATKRRDDQYTRQLKDQLYEYKKIREKYLYHLQKRFSPSTPLDDYKTILTDAQAQHAFNTIQEHERMKKLRSKPPFTQKMLV